MYLAIRLAARLNRMVDIRGMDQSRPNKRKRKSPGRDPKPSLRNAGVSQLMSIRARKTTMNQRIMVCAV